VALFALDDAHPALKAHREGGGSTCGLVDQQLWLTHQGVRCALGPERDLPLTLNGAANYNTANIAAAALAAAALGISAGVIATELRRFGSTRHDNPGRLDRWTLADITVLVDYAHNPGGLALLLAASRSARGRRGEPASRVSSGRLGLLLGQAGNRTDRAIVDLAQTAAAGTPDLIVLKEIAGMLRGRALGEVPELLRNALLAAGYPTERIRMESDEVEAACTLLRWAQPGDVLVLPIHQSGARTRLAAILDNMERAGWKAGSTLPIIGAESDATFAPSTA
jgi:UDP-N-acetylmuramyl tripeptide synthase